MLDRPFEECRGIGASFGYNRIEGTDDYMTPKALLETLCSLVSKGGNFLLNIGPAADGTIPVIMEERLLQMGKWLGTNGEAIYGTQIYTKKPQKNVYYTQKNGYIYAISDRYPFGELLLDKIAFKGNLKAELLGSDAPVKLAEKDGKVLAVFPSINPDDLKTEYMYTLKISE
jgi:alpha-L-fucosidase